MSARAEPCNLSVCAGGGRRAAPVKVGRGDLHHQLAVTLAVQAVDVLVPLSYPLRRSGGAIAAHAVNSTTEHGRCTHAPAATHTQLALSSNAVPVLHAEEICLEMVNVCLLGLAPPVTTVGVQKL